MPTFRIVSPERRRRAASLVLIAAWVAWRGFRYAGPGQYAGPVVGCLVAAGLLAWVIPVMRTCLVVTEEGLIDRRAVRSVRVAWLEITELRVARPGGLWGRFLRRRQLPRRVGRRPPVHAGLLAGSALSSPR
ncbi:MAG: hypothetical protein ACHP9Z_18030 [Streptosporangiales bacterium]